MPAFSISTSSPTLSAAALALLQTSPRALKRFDVYRALRDEKDVESRVMAEVLFERQEDVAAARRDRDHLLFTAEQYGVEVDADALKQADAVFDRAKRDLGDAQAKAKLINKVRNSARELCTAAVAYLNRVALEGGKK